MTDALHVGSTAANAAALAQAFTLAAELANTATGQAGGIGVPANQYVPVALINTRPTSFLRASTAAARQRPGNPARACSTRRNQAGSQQWIR